MIRVDGGNPYALNRRLQQVVDWDRLRSVERLAFAELDGRIMAAACVMGDDGDLAIVIVAMQQLSSENPDLTFTLELQPGYSTLRMVHGHCGADEPRVARLIRQQPAQRRPA